MTRKLHRSFLILVAMGTGMCLASEIQYTTTGMYPTGTTVTSLTAPGELFTLTFTVPVNPVTNAPDVAGATFETSASGTYMFGATTVDFTGVDFFPGPDGGFEAYNDITNGPDTLSLSMDGPQLYSGSPPDVTMLAISFDAGGGYTEFVINGSDGPAFTTEPTVTASTVPEPGTSAGAAVGVLLLAAAMLRRRVGLIVS
jgi:hypothetical protein